MVDTAISNLERRDEEVAVSAIFVLGHADRHLGRSCRRLRELEVEAPSERIRAAAARGVSYLCGGHP
jgi:hypothetical protein